MVLSLLSLLACSPGPSQATWQVSPYVEMAGALVWTSHDLARASVWVEDGLGQGWETPSSELGTEHLVSVLGLRGGHRYTLTPRLTYEDGSLWAGEPLEITQALPAAHVPAATVIGDWPSGYFSTHILTPDGSAAVFFDSAGIPVWTWEPERAFQTRIISAGLTPDGRSVAVSDIRDEMGDMEGHLSTVTLDGLELVDFEASDLHHHPVVTPEGTWGAFAKVGVEVEPYGRVLYDRLVEADPATGALRVLFDPMDHFEVEPLCDTHWELTLPSTSGGSAEQLFDWTHANSLVLSPDKQAWLLMFRHWDNIIRVERATGEVSWFLGGPHDTLGLTADRPDAFSHAHFSEATEDHLLVFDNHLHRDDGHSRVVKYSLDADAPSVELTFELWDEEHGPLEWLGDAITLPDGTLMISWTDQGRVSWHEPDGALKGQLLFPLGVASGRISYVEQMP